MGDDQHAHVLLLGGRRGVTYPSLKDAYQALETFWQHVFHAHDDDSRVWDVTEWQWTLDADDG